MTDAPCQPQGRERLGRLHLYLRARQQELARLAVERFDGSERTPADAEAVAEKDDVDALLALVDGLLFEAPAPRAWACALLGRRAK